MTRRRCFAAWVAALGGASANSAAQDTGLALLFGTVFRDSYLALPGARVVAYNEANPRKKYRAVTNFRGEYRIRVPAGDGTYVISASAPKFADEKRTAQVYGMDKTTTNFILRPRKAARTARSSKGGK